MVGSYAKSVSCSPWHGIKKVEYSPDQMSPLSIQQVPFQTPSYNFLDSRKGSAMHIWNDIIPISNETRNDLRIDWHCRDCQWIGMVVFSSLVEPHQLLSAQRISYGQDAHHTRYTTHVFISFSISVTGLVPSVFSFTDFPSLQLGSDRVCPQESLFRSRCTGHAYTIHSGLRLRGQTDDLSSIWPFETSIEPSNLPADWYSELKTRRDSELWPAHARLLCEGITPCVASRHILLIRRRKRVKFLEQKAKSLFWLQCLHFLLLLPQNK